MWENYGKILEEHWQEHKDWNALGNLVSEMRVESYRAGFREGGRASGKEALERLLEALS